MSIANKLTALNNVKTAIRTALTGKGANMSGVPFTGFAGVIDDLQVGGNTEIPYRSRLTIPGDTDPWHLSHTTATGLKQYAYRHDSGLTSVILPAVQSLPDSCFSGCTSLTVADFTALTSIERNAFNGCSAFNTFILRGTSVATLADMNAFAFTPFATGTGKVFVPDNLVAAYKEAPIWSYAPSLIFPISQKP